MAGQPTATLTEGATLSHVLGLKDGSTIRQSLGDLAAQLLVSPELAALIGNYELFQGEWDASGGVFPSGAAKGHFWRVSQAGAGTVDGISFAASDVLIALVDNASTEVYADNWHKAAYTGISHEHAISAIVGLQAALDAKASAEQGEKADTAVQPGDLADVATTSNSDDLSEGVAKLLMTAAERSKLAGIEAGVFPVSDRPGDHPEAFSAGYTGAGGAKEPLSGGTEVVGAGTAYVLTGAGTVAARYPVALNNDVVEFTARFRRTANPSDPNNHAVRLQVAWLDKSKSLIGSVQTLATKSDALTSSGLVELSARVSALAVENVVTPPMGAVYACPFIQTYGEDGATAIETLRSLEVSDLHAVESADLSTLIAQTEAARDAAEAAADAVATETLDTMADVASYTRAAGVGVISLKGGYAAHDGLGGQWAYDSDGVEVTASPPELLIGADGANYRMVAGNLVYRSKPDIAALISAPDIAVGQKIAVSKAYNNEREHFVAVPAATYTANGTTVVDGVSVQLISTRTWFRNFADMDADTRPAGLFVTDPATDPAASAATADTSFRFSVRGLAEYGMARSGASDSHVTLTGGGVKLYALPGEDGWYSAAALNFDTTAIQAVLTAGGKVRLPAGTMNTAVTLTVPASGALVGVGHSSVLNATADVTPVKVTGSFALLEHFKITETHGSHTQNGIEVGNASGTENGGRATLRGLMVTGMGADGIIVRAGNLGTIADCACTANGQDGIRFTDENADNNAWRLEGFVDVRSNTRHGAVFEGGTGSADANASRQHTGVIVAQQNGGDGVKIESRSNRFEIYSEANTGEDTNLTALSKGNKIATVEGSVLDSGDYNIVEFHNGNAQYRQVIRGRMRFTDEDGWQIGNDTYTGTARLFHDSNATHKLYFEDTGAKQTFRIKNTASLSDIDADAAVYSVAVQFKGAAIERERLIFTDGDTTPDVTLSEFWLANNTSATTITTFDGGHPGQRITVLFNNGNTTINHSSGSGIHLKGGANKTYAQYEVAEFIRNGSGWWIEV